MSEFNRRLEDLIKEYHLDSRYDTPDFVLSSYFNQVLEAFLNSMKARDCWHYDKMGRKVGESLSKVLA